MTTLFALYLWTHTSINHATWQQQGVFINERACMQAAEKLGMAAPQKSRCIDTGISNGSKTK